MHIVVQEPDGPRQAVVPSEGINSELGLIKSLIMTLAKESDHCTGDVILRVDLAGADPIRLVTIAKMLAEQGVQISTSMH